MRYGEFYSDVENVSCANLRQILKWETFPAFLVDGAICICMGVRRNLGYLIQRLD
jgi:hypothetical protein